MSRRAQIIALLASLLAAGAAGYAAGPVLARVHDTVELAELVHTEGEQGLVDDTFESEAWRVHGGTRQELYLEAMAIESRFRIGGALLGLWIALAACSRLFVLARRPVQPVHDIDLADCLACGRCYRSCPIERGECEH